MFTYWKIWIYITWSPIIDKKIPAKFIIFATFQKYHRFAQTMPIIFKAKSTFRSVMHFQKLIAILLTAPKAQTTNESV